VLHIYAALAETERALISQRTTAALKAAKARGVVLGNPKLAEARARAHRARAEEADRQAALVMPHIKPLRDEGVSLRGIARELGSRRADGARRRVDRGAGGRHPAAGRTMTPGQRGTIAILRDAGAPLTRPNYIGVDWNDELPEAWGAEEGVTAKERGTNNHVATGTPPGA
jgi:DNA invertase Pin-like site-specific DNA recombinase